MKPPCHAPAAQDAPQQSSDERKERLPASAPGEIDPTTLESPPLDLRTLIPPDQVAAALLKLIDAQWKLTKALGNLADSIRELIDSDRGADGEEYDRKVEELQRYGLDGPPDKK